MDSAFSFMKKRDVQSEGVSDCCYTE